MLPDEITLFFLLSACSNCFAQELPLYNGAEYTEFYQGTTGHPFFKSDSLLTCEILYDGIVYKNVLMGFNLADNKILIKAPVLGYAISLINSKIVYFIIDGHRFERAITGNDTRFYEIIYRNKVKVYAERYKRLRSGFSPEDPMKFVVGTTP